MTTLIITFGIVTLAAILGILYALREVLHTSRDLAAKLMARDLTEYARAKPMIEHKSTKTKPNPEPKPERRARVQATSEVMDIDIVGAQAAFNELREG